MDNMHLYLFRVSAVTLFLYLLYFLFFSRDTFYLRNRIYLLLTLILPVILPLIKMPEFSNGKNYAEQAITLNSIVLSGSSIGTSISGTINSFTYSSYLVWIYFAIAGYLIFKLLVSLVCTFRIIRKGLVISKQFPMLIVSDHQHPPFSFFPYVVIPEEVRKSSGYREILAHENAHVRQGHTFDLLLSELFIAIQWFNPVVWLIKKAIVSNHEYLADKISIKKAVSTRDYQFQLLNLAIGIKNVPLAHNFSSLIKNRIVMINKKPTSGSAILKNILILPVLALVMYAFAEPEYRQSSANINTVTAIQSQTNITKVVQGVIVQSDGNPLTGAAVIIKGTTVGTITDSKGRFKLADVPADAMLVISYVGFKTVASRPDFFSEMKITMMREAINKGIVNIEPGQPEEGSDRIKIRNSGTGVSANPLIVVDGIVTDIQMDKIDVQTIQSISVSKGEYATKKYGVKGQDGVIEITTIKNDSLLKSKMSDVKVTGYGSDKKADKDVMTIVEELPEFPGGENGMIRWLSENVKYPGEAVKAGITGMVKVSFIVSSRGEVINAHVSEPGNSLLDAEAIRVISNMPDWKPGSQSGKPVDVEIVVPVEFKLK
jgi:TonB family protein